jgi:hypothetical protein
MECAQFAAPVEHRLRFQSGSKLRALHTLRDFLQGSALNAFKILRDLRAICGGIGARPLGLGITHIFFLVVA